MQRSRRARLVPALGTAAGVAAVDVLIALIRLAIDIPNLSILYLLPVMFCAVTWGWWTALGAAVLAFLSYDFFFVEPIFTCGPTATIRSWPPAARRGWTRLAAAIPT